MHACPAVHAAAAATAAVTTGSQSHWSRCDLCGFVTAGSIWLIGTCAIYVLVAPCIEGVAGQASPLQLEMQRSSCPTLTTGH